MRTRYALALVIVVFVTMSRIPEAQADHDLMVMPAWIGSCEVAFTVRNRGSEAFPAVNWTGPRPVSIQVDVNGSMVYRQPLTAIDPQRVLIQPRGELLKGTGKKLPARPARVKVTAIGIIGDDNPANNAEEVTFVCPDIVPSGPILVQPARRLGASVGPAAAVEFSGKLLVVGGVAPGFVRWELDGRKLAEQQPVPVQGGEYASSCVWPAPKPGRHTVRMIVDARGEVAEANERNNAGVLTFNVPLP